MRENNYELIILDPPVLITCSCFQNSGILRYFLLQFWDVLYKTLMWLYLSPSNSGRQRCGNHHIRKSDKVHSNTHFKPLIKPSVQPPAGGEPLFSRLGQSTQL